MAQITYAMNMGYQEPGLVEKQITEMITRLKYSTPLRCGMQLKFVETDCWDIWNLYLSDVCIFQVKESPEGYKILYSERELLEKIFEPSEAAT